MTTFCDVMKVDSVERLNNSRNGNPRYEFHFANGLKWKTPVDAGWVYGIVPSRFENADAKVFYKKINTNLRRAIEKRASWRVIDNWERQAAHGYISGDKIERGEEVIA